MKVRQPHDVLKPGFKFETGLRGGFVSDALTSIGMGGTVDDRPQTLGPTKGIFKNLLTLLIYPDNMTP